MPPDAMLGVVFALGSRVNPCFLRGFAIVRVDGVQPFEPKALVDTKTGEFNPLRTGPSPLAVGSRQEDKLWDAGGQQTKALLALAQTFARLVLVGAIAGNLDKTCVPLQRHKKTRRPKSRSVFSLMPPLIGGAAVTTGASSLLLRSALGPVLGCEDHIRRTTYYLRF